jgi:hypothetical protein
MTCLHCKAGPLHPGEYERAAERRRHYGQRGEAGG